MLTCRVTRRVVHVSCLRRVVVVVVCMWQVFTARSRRLDRWKLRVLTADVLDRDLLPMLVPPNLRKTTSLETGSLLSLEMDAQLLQVQIDQRKSMYRRNLAATQRVAALWFADRQKFERQKVG